MKRKVVILIGILALLVGINMQVAALNTNKDIKSNNIKAEAEIPLDQWMPDKNLQKALVTAMGLKDVSELTQESLSRFSGFVDVSNNNIKDIRGLEYAISTPRIDINENQISDLSSLSGLKNLQDLWANQNQISDLSPLSGLMDLEILGIASNKISDLSPLSGLKKLSSLSVPNNHINELSPLSGMKNLGDLSISSNQISNLSPLSGLEKLETLGVYNNHISDLSPLSGLKKLTLVFANNQTINNKELIGYVGYKTGQKSNIINVDKSKIDITPISSGGEYDKATKTINWAYTTTGLKNPRSTFNIKLNNDQVFSGEIMQPIRVKMDLTSIEVKDSEIQVNDVWKAKDNFVSATNQDGEAIGIEGIKVEGRVNTSKAGIYKVTYTILNNAGTKISKEASIQVKAKENAHDDNKHPGDKDRLPKTGYDISIVGYLLGIAGILGAGSLYLNRKQ